jgi:flagellar biosynthesis chaperone FliJ
MVALRKPKPFTVDELEAQLGTLRADVDKTSVSLEALKGRRRELLLSADDAQVVAHDEAVKAAERQIERLKVRADALGRC